jgi:hypothetical protein
VQATRQDSKIRDMRLELEERERLLARTKAAIETLQNDLARAHKDGDGLRVETREQLDVQAQGLHSFTSQLNISAFCGTGVRSGVIHGVFTGC